MNGTAKFPFEIQTETVGSLKEAEIREIIVNSNIIPEDNQDGCYISLNADDGEVLWHTSLLEFTPEEVDEAVNGIYGDGTVNNNSPKINECIIIMHKLGL